MKLGDMVLLHKHQNPEFKTAEPDEFVAVRITEMREVSSADGGEQSIGFRGLGDDGKHYGLNWTGLSTYDVWLCGERSEKERWWYDATAINAPWQETLPSAPIWLQKYPFVHYCPKHHELFYEGEQCHDCEMEEKYPKPADAPRAWNGWV